MTAHERTEITVETDRILIIRRNRVLRVWCPKCGCEVEMVGAGEVEEFTGMTGQALRDWAQARGGHFSEGQGGTRLICLDSLLKLK